MSARGTPSRRSRAASSETCTVSDCRVPTTMLAMLSPLSSSRGLPRPTVQCPFNANVRADAAKYSPRAPAHKACPAAPSVSRALVEMVGRVACLGDGPRLFARSPRATAPGPGCRPGAGRDRAPPRHQSPHPTAVGAAAGDARHPRPGPQPRPSGQDRPRRPSGPGGAGAGVPRRHAGRALRPVGRRHRGRGRHGDDGAPTTRPAPAAQKKSLIARERDDAARAAWREEAAGLDPADLVFLDETSTPTTLTPLRARAPRGQRAIGRVPRGRWVSVTLLATLTPTGMGAAMLLEGAADQAAFEAFVAQHLVPSLRPGQTVVLDNLSVHKSARARDLIAAAGCALRFLPTCSPDFNPIEHAFAKIKQHLRRAEARSFAALRAATGPALDAVTPADAHAFYHAAGFTLPTIPGQPLLRAL